MDHVQLSRRTSYHMDYGAAAAKYVDVFMDNIRWENVSSLHRQHAR